MRSYISNKTVPIMTPADSEKPSEVCRLRSMQMTAALSPDPRSLLSPSIG